MDFLGIFYGFNLIFADQGSTLCPRGVLYPRREIKRRSVMAGKKTAAPTKKRFLSLRQIEGVFKKLDIPVFDGGARSVNSEPFQQFSLIKYVDVVVESNSAGGK